MSTTLPNLVSTESATLNLTFTDSTIADIPERIKTASYVLTSIMLTYSLYLSIGMLSYGTKKKKWKIKKRGGQIYIGCFAAIVLGFFNVLVHLVQIALIQYHESCVVSGQLDNFFGILAMFSIYLFLWMRQKVIYDSPMVESFTNKSVKVISWLLLILTLGFMAYSIIHPMISRAMQMNSCMIYFQGNWLVFSFSIISQIVYCVLFVYPMIKIHLAKLKNSQQFVREMSHNPTTEETNVITTYGSHDNVNDQNGKTSATNGSNHNSKQLVSVDNQPRSDVYSIPASADKCDRNVIGKRHGIKSKAGKLTKHAARLNETVRRCLICAIVTVITDLCFIVAAEVTLGTISDKYERKIINNIMFDFDIILNGTAVLSTFTGFIDIMTFWIPESWRKSDNIAENSNSNTSAGGLQ